jgi:hypothetical protein
MCGVGPPRRQGKLGQLLKKEYFESGFLFVNADNMNWFIDYEVEKTVFNLPQPEWKKLKDYIRS